MPAAFERLKDKWDRTIARDERRKILSAIAMLRLESAIEFLSSLIATENQTSATDALNALATFKSNNGIRETVASAVRRRGDEKLQSTFEREFAEK
jgi:hypothetical protein